MREYEVVLIVSPELSKQDLTEFESRMADVMLRNGGAMVELDGPNKQKLAYEISNSIRGYFYFAKVVLPSYAVKEVVRNLRITDRLLRFFILYLRGLDVTKEELETLRSKLPRRAYGVLEQKETLEEEA